MLAARAGNVALIETLLARGADPELADDYGHTAWMGALNRAIDDPAFARAHLGALFEPLGPETLDVQTGGRLVRLERGQGEFWLLGLMLAGLKTHCGGSYRPAAWARPHTARLFSPTACSRRSNVCRSIFGRSPRKKDYINGVLARAEIESGYRPARKLWKRRELGYYVPAPDMKLRRKTADGEAWIPIAEALGLAAVSDGGEGRLFDVYALPRAGASAAVG